MSTGQSKSDSRPRYCYLCRTKVTAAEYCNGCKQYVCNRCDVNEPMGSHSVEAHGPARKAAFP